MNSSPLVFTVEVRNPKGLHLRAINTLVEAASQFRSVISVEKDAEKATCDSVLSLMTLGADQGTQLTVTVDGEDANPAAEAIRKLFENGFYELEEA